jgi:hypothetical protein
MSIEAMKQALDALKLAKSSYGVILTSYPAQDAWVFHGVDKRCFDAITALRQAIEQAEKQEPVAYKYTDKTNPLVFYFTELKGKDVTQNLDVIETALYTAPPQREWVGLTDAELAEFSAMKLGAYDLCLEVEAKLKEKNGG